ncbi:MAG TPA: response regulator [Burkholderiales bacterium]|jgi:CheY-like chemotaxis protein|nr:response regulator [Burkholderiales bacterium]
MPKPKVLVVDDVRLTAELARAMLAHGGIEAEAVYSGAHALDWLNANEAALILSDWYMPGMNGAQLADAVQRRAPNRPWLLAYTACNDAQERELILAAGFDEVLQKPARAEELASTVKSWLSRSRAD